MLKVTLALGSCVCSVSAVTQDRYDLPDSGSHPQFANLRALEKQERALRIAREKSDLANDADTLADLANPKSKVKAKAKSPDEEEAPDKEDEEQEEEEMSDDM